MSQLSKNLIFGACGLIAGLNIGSVLDNIRVANIDNKGLGKIVIDYFEPKFPRNDSPRPCHDWIKFESAENRGNTIY